MGTIFLLGLDEKKIFFELLKKFVRNLRIFVFNKPKSLILNIKTHLEIDFYPFYQLLLRITNIVGVGITHIGASTKLLIHF